MLPCCVYAQFEAFALSHYFLRVINASEDVDLVFELSECETASPGVHRRELLGKVHVLVRVYGHLGYFENAVAKLRLVLNSVIQAADHDDVAALEKHAAREGKKVAVHARFDCFPIA